eukprot:TRINITY_DN2901_c0_g1_i7.p1 TRINITY_DN2901_c0_g1~~TRINITY_DN2901_c0_g1_i7.p1  ORF type:complete len:156 (+),score=28.85 TRINITY_DN2901_c0_g1_i7:809-1276(+)
MSFLTYVLLMGFILGTSDNFHPEVLGLTATGALVVLILENLVLNMSYYVLSIPFSPHPLDTIALTSYKFVPVNTSLLVWIMLGDLAYYIAAIIVSISFGMFVARSLQSILTPKAEIPNINRADRSRKNTFLLVLGLFQVPICLYLGRTAYRLGKR